MINSSAEFLIVMETSYNVYFFMKMNSFLDILMYMMNIVMRFTIKQVHIITAKSSTEEVFLIQDDTKCCQ